MHHSQPSAPEGGQELGGSQQPFLAQPPCLMAGPWGPHHDPPLVLPCCRQSSPQSCPRPHLVGVSRDYLTLMGCRGNPQANRWLLMGWHTYPAHPSVMAASTWLIPTIFQDPLITLLLTPWQLPEVFVWLPGSPATEGGLTALRMGWCRI